MEGLDVRLQEGQCLRGRAVRSLILAVMCGIAIMAAAPAACDRRRRQVQCRWTTVLQGHVRGRCDDRASRPTHGRPSQTQQRDRQDAENQKVLETRKKFSAAFAEYDRRLASYNRCMLIFDPSLNNAGCGNAPTPPNTPEFRSDTFSGRGNQPIRITAGQAAAIAVARLQLPKIPPGIGPVAGHQPMEHGRGRLPALALGRRPYPCRSDFRLGRGPIRVARCRGERLDLPNGRRPHRHMRRIGPPLDNGRAARHRISELRLLLRQTLIAGQRLHGGSHRQLGCHLDQQRPIGSDQRPRS